MVTIGALLVPILVSAAAVWVVSAIVWMALPHHKKDFAAVPDEEAARDVLGKMNLAPGQYNIPHVTSQEELKKPEVAKKFEEGPLAFMTVLPNGMPAMGKNMALSFAFYVFAGILIAYVAGRTLEPGTAYLKVFQIVGAVTWMAYGLAVVQDAVWFGRPWSAVFKNFFDALLYALVTAGVFGWLWPR